MSEGFFSKEGTQGLLREGQKVFSEKAKLSALFFSNKAPSPESLLKDGKRVFSEEARNPSQKVPRVLEVPQRNLDELVR